MRSKSHALFVTTDHIYQGLLNDTEEAFEPDKVTRATYRALAEKSMQLFGEELGNPVSWVTIMDLKLRMLRHLKASDWPAEIVAIVSSVVHMPLIERLESELRLLRSLEDAIQAYEHVIEHAEEIEQDTLNTIICIEQELPNVGDEIIDQILFGGFTIGELLTLSPGFLTRFVREEELEDEN